MHSSYRIFLTCHISETAWDRHILPEQKRQEIASSIQWHLLMTLDDPQTYIPFFFARRYASAVYIVWLPCVSPSVRPLRGRGTARCNSCRGPASRSRRTRGLLLQTLSSGAVWQCTRPIAIGTVVEHPGGNVQALPCFSSWYLLFSCVMYR